jgi:hypothetical protein
MRELCIPNMNATVMDEIGTPLKTTQTWARAGETTMNHYIHKVDAEDRKAAEVIGAMLSPTVEAVM